MNWDALGAIGELLGSLVVLITLVYLAIQTRNINRQSQAEARYAFVDAMAQVNMAIANSKESASVWRRGLESFDELDKDEKMQFFMFMGQCANLWSVMHQLHVDDLLPETQWLVVRNDMRSLLSSQGGKVFWESGGESAFDSGFADFVNAQLAANSKAYDMAAMLK